MKFKQNFGARLQTKIVLSRIEIFEITRPGLVLGLRPDLSQKCTPQVAKK